MHEMPRPTLPIMNRHMMWHHALLAAAYMDDRRGFDLLLATLADEHEPPVCEHDVSASVRLARNAGMWPGKRGKPSGEFAYAGYGWGVVVYKGLPYPCRTGVVLGAPLARAPGKNPGRMLDAWAQNDRPMDEILWRSYKTFLSNAH